MLSRLTHTMPEADLSRAEHALINVARARIIVTYQANMLMPPISKAHAEYCPRYLTLIIADCRGKTHTLA
jgi:hypothetical protein